MKNNQVKILQNIIAIKLQYYIMLVKFLHVSKHVFLKSKNLTSDEKTKGYVLNKKY
tara:strand:+ start:209 stop:376 length:168 start_codon:yes stop_codon:yes gene_type:complete